MSTATLKDGRIVAIAGPVVDVEFPPDALPEINTALEFDIDMEGERTTVRAEVAQQIGDSRVRAIALKPTDGLSRGSVVRNLGVASKFEVYDQSKVREELLNNGAREIIFPALDPEHQSRPPR